MKAPPSHIAKRSNQVTRFQCCSMIYFQKFNSKKFHKKYFLNYFGHMEKSIAHIGACGQPEASLIVGHGTMLGPQLMGQ